MARKVLILRSAIRPLESRVGLAVALCVLIALSPWIWKGALDAYFPYSGTVVDKGSEFHLLNLLCEDSSWVYYIIVENDHGVRTKKYVSDVGYIWVDKGTFVVKKRGFGEMPLRPGQKTPGELIREHEERKAAK
jgi:hypothetical protein